MANFLGGGGSVTMAVCKISEPLVNTSWQKSNKNETETFLLKLRTNVLTISGNSEHFPFFSAHT